MESSNSKYSSPKVSVITVCYNAIESIEGTIRSVVAQTYNNIEYIVVDGGSTDGTLDVINRYENKISKIISEPDKGIYDAMNKGIKAATGEWINFRNSGDMFATREVVSEMFKEPVDDDVAVLHGDCYFVSDFDYIKTVPPIVNNPDSYKYEMPVHHSASFIRAKVHKDTPFDLSYKASADYDFFYKCSKKGLRFEYRPVAVATFAIGGYTSTHKGVTIRENRRLQGKYNTRIDRFLTETKIKKIEVTDKVKQIIASHSKYVRERQLRNRKKAGWLLIDGTEPFELKF